MENFLNIIFTEKNKSLFIQLAEKAKLGEQVELEYFTKSSLSSRWLFYKISPVYNEKRFVIGILMTVNDIDKQKKHKIELQKSEEKFRKIVHSAAHPIMIVDLSMKIMLVNPETELVFGYSEDELLGKSISLLIPERFQKNHKQDILTNFQVDKDKGYLSHGHLPHNPDFLFVMNQLRL